MKTKIKVEKKVKTAQEETNILLTKMLKVMHQISSDSEDIHYSVESLQEDKHYQLTFFTLRGYSLTCANSHQFPVIGEVMLLDNLYLNVETNQRNLDSGFYTEKQIADFIKEHGETKEIPVQVVKVIKHYSCQEYIDTAWVEDLHVTIKFYPDYYSELTRMMITEKVR